MLDIESHIDAPNPDEVVHRRCSQVQHGGGQAHLQPEQHESDPVISESGPPGWTAAKRVRQSRLPDDHDGPEGKRQDADAGQDAEIRQHAMVDRNGLTTRKGRRQQGDDNAKNGGHRQVRSG